MQRFESGGRRGGRRVMSAVAHASPLCRCRANSERRRKAPVFAPRPRRSTLSVDPKVTKSVTQTQRGDTLRPPLTQPNHSRRSLPAIDRASLIESLRTGPGASSSPRWRLSFSRRRHRPQPPPELGGEPGSPRDRSERPTPKSRGRAEPTPSKSRDPATEAGPKSRDPATRAGPVYESKGLSRCRCRSSWSS